MPDESPPTGRVARARRQSGAGSGTTGQRLPPNFVVVGIGASAGGLNACRQFLAAFIDGPPMAFILIQHLHPDQESLMPALLAEHTALAVREAAEQDILQPGYLYLIPPGTHLAVSSGRLHVSYPQSRSAARLPFDFLLASLATAYGPRAACVVLSGTGPDGSQGARAIRENGGLVIAQNPGEAEYDGMPRAAIATGCVDTVLPVAGIHTALVDFAGQVAALRNPASGMASGKRDMLSAIIDLLRTTTAHDFTLYKPGTLRRRIERRMAMAPLAAGDMESYLAALQDDPSEIERLAKDLLINVTGFFRDSHVFDTLAGSVVPDLVQRKAPDQPLRIWVAGCSTGEETYSLAMVFREAITASRRNMKLQIFASDVDAEAVAQARDGFYPESIASLMSPERLARFFQREEGGYRVLPELRSSVVFAVQDLLADPPFSRIDLVSCRNLLIYLKPEAQAKVVSLFDFALAEGGVLLLGSAETIGDPDGRFEVISKAARLYRHSGRSAPGALGFWMGTGGSVRAPARTGQGLGPSRQAALATLTQRLVLEAHAPAAVLINQKHECLYSLGPTERYLRVPAGLPSQDLLAMARPGIRTKLRAAIYRATQDKSPVVIPGGRMSHEGKPVLFRIVIRPVMDDGEALLLITFVDEAGEEPAPVRAMTADDPTRVQALELELEAARTELQGAIRNLEISNEEQRAVNEETLSVNEEYQSTNEELLTSKEELQSLNEELTALNSQLQEMLERQRTMSNDLQNVLYSTDMATLFLDRDLHIRFFTPATQSLFNVISSDLGRPLTDISALGVDGALTADVLAVLADHTPVEREIEGQQGTWFSRRILPYRRLDNSVEGVVITFTDVTERRRVAQMLSAAQQRLEAQALSKARLMDEANQELRQSLQALVILQELLSAKAEAGDAAALIARADLTISSMTGLLNTLVAVDQGDGSTEKAEAASFAVEDILEPLRAALGGYARAKGLGLQVMPCSLAIRSDARLLDLLLRNLLTNMLRHIADGRVLVGCRRRPGRVRIEIWANGIDLPASTLETMLDGRPSAVALPAGRSLGQSLAFSRRLGDLMGHPVHIVTTLGRVSVFTIEVPLAAELPLRAEAAVAAVPGGAGRTGSILVVAEDPDIRDLLKLLLASDGHRVVTAPDGPAAVAVTGSRAQPDAVLIDLDDVAPQSRLDRARAVRDQVHRNVPIVLLMDEGAAAALRPSAPDNLICLAKPVRAAELRGVVQRVLAAPRSGSGRPRRRR